MNPQQFPPQPGQMPGYPGAPGPLPPGQPFPPLQQPPGQPGGWPASPPMAGPSYPQPPPQQAYGQPAGGFPMAAGPMPGPAAPAAGYNPFAYPGEYDTPPKKGPSPKLFIAIIGGVLLLVIIIAVVAMSGSSGNRTPTQNTSGGNSTTSTAGNDVVPRSDNTLDLSLRIDPKANLKAQTVKARTSEQVNLSSGFSFMVTKTEDYTSPNPATKPGANKKFVAVTVVVGNRKQDGNGNISVSYTDFRLRDASNVLIPGSSVTNELLNNPIATPTEVKPGEQLTGKVVFEVDANDVAWVFKHTETYQKTTDNTTFTVEGEIVSQLPGAASNSATTSGATGGTTPATP